MIINDGNNDNEEKPVNKQQSNDFVYTVGHPEQFLNDQAITKLKKSALVKDISHIVIDEIHCIVTWGKDFRRDYQELYKLKFILYKHISLVWLGLQQKQWRRLFKIYLAYTSLSYGHR